VRGGKKKKGKQRGRERKMKIERRLLSSRCLEKGRVEEE